MEDKPTVTLMLARRDNTGDEVNDLSLPVTVAPDGRFSITWQGREYRFETADDLAREAKRICLEKDCRPRWTESRVRIGRNGGGNYLATA